MQCSPKGAHASGSRPCCRKSANSLPWSSRSIGYRRVFSDRQGVDRIGNSRGGEGVEGSATPRFRHSLIAIMVNPTNRTESEDFLSIVHENQIFVEIHWPAARCAESRKNG